MLIGAAFTHVPSIDDVTPLCPAYHLKTHQTFLFEDGVPLLPATANVVSLYRRSVRLFLKNHSMRHGVPNQEHLPGRGIHNRAVMASRRDLPRVASVAEGLAPGEQKE
jgi:hypothetical protein